jgi:chromosome segregation ATPase
MQFHDYAATEASTLITRLLARQSEGTLHQLRAVRAALEAAAQALETAPRADDDVQALVMKLTTVVETESRRAAEELRRVTEEGRRRLDEANAALTMQLDENAALAGAIAQAQAEAALLRSELATAQEHGEAVERDLTATVEAHGELERILKATDIELRQTTQARTQLDAELSTVKATAQRSSAEADHLRAELYRVSDDGLRLRELLDQATSEGHDLRGALERAAAEKHELRIALDGATAQTARLQCQIDEYQTERIELDRQLIGAHQALSDRDVKTRELEAANSRARSIEAELTAKIDLLAIELEAANSRARSIEAELTAKIDLLTIEREAANSRARSIDAELSTKNDLLAIEFEAASARVRTVEAALADAQKVIAGHDTVVSELGAARARTLSLEKQHTERTEQARNLQARLDAALQAEARLRETVARPSDVRPDEQQTDTLRWELDRMVSLFDASVRAVNEMTSARTSGDLLAELVKRLSIQFSRVALFRVKGNGLEGEHHVGFENIDIARLVLPVTVDSLLTRALQSGATESVSGADIASRLGTPFGGSPTSAVALPIVLQGTTLAVVYADDADMPDHARGPAVHESSVGFAKLLVSEAAVLLMCHTHELKTLAELRQYATTLLQEAKAMYLADAEAGKPAAQLRGRLKDNLECASQLYAYRAAMEGTAAAALLDEQIAVEMAASTPFARDLSDVVHSMATSDLGITAEAS